ncbi:unnamed protein product, partial [Nesidiocoris tenuis]
MCRSGKLRRTRLSEYEVRPRDTCRYYSVSQGGLTARMHRPEAPLLNVLTDLDGK